MGFAHMNLRAGDRRAQRRPARPPQDFRGRQPRLDIEQTEPLDLGGRALDSQRVSDPLPEHLVSAAQPDDHPAAPVVRFDVDVPRSEEHTSELQSLMRISYAVFCLTKKKVK